MKKETATEHPLKTEADCPTLQELAAEVKAYWSSRTEADTAADLAYVREHIGPEEALEQFNSYSLQTGEEAKRMAMAIMRAFTLGAESATTGEVLLVCECCGSPNIQPPTLH